MKKKAKVSTHVTPQERYLIELLSAGFSLSTSLVKSGIKFASAKEKLSELRKKPAFVALLETRKVEVAEECVVSKDRVIREIADIAFSDITDYYDDNGSPRKLKDIPGHARRAVRTIESKMNDQGKPMLKGYDLHSKMEALSQLSRNMGYINDNANVSIELNLKELTDAELIARLSALRAGRDGNVGAGVGATTIDQKASVVLPG